MDSIVLVMLGVSSFALLVALVNLFDAHVELRKLRREYDELAKLNDSLIARQRSKQWSAGQWRNN